MESFIEFYIDFWKLDVKFSYLEAIKLDFSHIRVEHK